MLCQSLDMHRTRAVVAASALAITAGCSSGDQPTEIEAQPVPTAVETAPIEPGTAPTEPAPATSSSAGTAATTDAADPTEAPATTTEPEVEPIGRTPEELMRVLAGDEFGGRDNLTPGSAAAREVLISELGLFAEPLPDAGDFEQPFLLGANVLGVVPGGDLADEYVIVGGHYDHLSTCRLESAVDAICNGAADNAAGVAAAIAAGKAMAALGPRRSVIVALWDAEEDGLFGARHYVDEPLVPLADTVAYVNVDLIAANLLPSLSASSLAIGAETGGQPLVDAVSAAEAASPLDLVRLSVLFGQGRSDHAPFVDAGVPAVFVSDATNGCYHSVFDDMDHVDLDKFDHQVDVVVSIVEQLAFGDVAPSFQPGAPPIGFDDAVELLAMLDAGADDLPLLGGNAAALAAGFRDGLRAIVDAGADAFDGGAAQRVAVGAASLIEVFASQECR